MENQSRTAPSKSKAWRFRVDPKVTVGEFLTVITIIISVFSLLDGFSKDRTLRQREEVANFRNAAAQTLAKLDRVETLSVSACDQAQPLFVKVSEFLATHHEAQGARDMLWSETDRNASEH